jgi:small subunit ribosomal protein S4
MGRYTGPKDKLSRREGKELFGRDRPALLQKLKQPPGQHGAIRGRRLSEYGLQLREKQKVKRMYGMREKQFKKFYKMAENEKGTPTGIALLQLLEQRLDNVVYRLGMARTRPQARQFVSHGKVMVDGEKVTIPSYIVKPGQKVALVSEAFNSPYIQEILKDALSLPEWLEVKGGAGHVKRKPEREEIDQDINENLIVAFYSR